MSDICIVVDLILYIDAHIFLDHPENDRDMLVLGVDYEVRHGFPDQRLDLTVVGRVVQQYSRSGESEDEGQRLQSDVLLGKKFFFNPSSLLQLRFINIYFINYLR